jgi:hypothetical protein
LVLAATLSASINAEIGSKHGHFDSAMLPIWRGTLSFALTSAFA